MNEFEANLTIEVYGKIYKTTGNIVKGKVECLKINPNNGEVRKNASPWYFEEGKFTIRE